MNNLRLLALSAGVIFLTHVAQAAPFVVNSAGSRVTGSAIQSAPDGTICLTTLNGQVLTFRAGSYRQAGADKPPEMRQVETLAKQGNLAGAVKILIRVKQQYSFLGWDQRASRMLARVYLSLGQFEPSVREYEALFEVQPDLKTIPIERANYMQALRGAERMDEVVGMIDEDIASGSREAAARAQIIRGDMKLEAGQQEEALLDYLRTVILFRAQMKVLPEATYKTAMVLKKMNDPRAADYFRKVIETFPKSEFADRARKEVE